MGLQTANKQIASLREALQVAQKTEIGRASGIESLQAELERCRAQLAELKQVQRLDMLRHCHSFALESTASCTDVCGTVSALEHIHT